MVHLDVVPAFPPVRVLAALLLLVACGDSSDGSASGASTGGTDGASTGGTDGASTGGTDGASTAPTSTVATEDPGEPTTASACAAEAKATDDCCCFSAMTDESNNLSIRDDCPVGASACASIAVTCMADQGVDCAANEAIVEDSQASAVACVVDALGAGTPARVSWDFAGIPGFSGRSVTLYIAGDQTVFRLPSKFEDLSSEDGPVERFTLPPSAFFADCAAMATATQQFECLTGFLDGAAIETCSPG